MPAIYKEGTWYGGTAKAEEISIKIGLNDLRLAETVQNIVEDIAPIETNSTNAINSYNIGDLLTHNGILYRVINDIAPGDQLVEGTNITKTTITQGVDLTDRVVALENKTLKISQESNTLKVNDTDLQINKFFVAGTSTTSNDKVGFLLRKPERSIDVLISDTSAGLYDRTNSNWILKSDNNQNITIPHQVEVSNGNVYASKGLFISGSAASTADQGIRLQNKTRNLLLTTGLSTATASGLYDSNARNWVFSYNYGNTTNDNYVYTPFNTFVGNTSITTSRGVRVRNTRRDISLHVDTNAGIYDHGDSQWIIYATTDHHVYIPHSLNVTGNTTLPATAASSLNVSGNTSLKGTTVTSLTNTGNTSLKATTVSSLTSSGNISAKSGHVFIGDSASTVTSEQVCRVFNSKRNLQFTCGGTSNSPNNNNRGNAGIYENTSGISGWVLRSGPDGHVYVPHPFTTTNFVAEGTLNARASTVSSLTVAGNTTLAATTANALLCGNVVYPSAHGPAIISYGVATRNNRQIGQILDNEDNKGVVFVRANGTGTLAKTISYPTSDRRLKENIKIASRSGLDLINKLDVVEFDWKDSKRHWNYGIIAQDAAKIDENIVTGEEKENEYLSIDTLYLIDVLVKATQELSALVTELKEKIKILEEKIN